MLVTGNDGALAERMRAIRNFGQIPGSTSSTPSSGATTR